MENRAHGYIDCCVVSQDGSSGKTRFSVVRRIQVLYQPLVANKSASCLSILPLVTLAYELYVPTEFSPRDLKV